MINRAPFASVLPCTTDVVKVRKAGASLKLLLFLTLCSQSFGATLRSFENIRIDNWKLEMMANAEETVVQFCRQNETRNENHCKNLTELVSKCGCTISPTDENKGNLNCHSSLADCPHHLSVNLQLGKVTASNTGHTATITCFLGPFISLIVILFFA